MAFTVPFSKKSENTSDAIFVVKKKQKTEQLCGIGNFSGWETGKESTTNRAIDVGARGGGIVTSPYAMLHSCLWLMCETNITQLHPLGMQLCA